MKLSELLDKYTVRELFRCTKPRVNLFYEDFSELCRLCERLIVGPPLARTLKDSEIVIEGLCEGDKKIWFAWFRHGRKKEPCFYRPAQFYLNYEVVCRTDELSELSQLYVVLLSMTAMEVSPVQRPSDYMRVLMEQEEPEEPEDDYEIQGETLLRYRGTDTVLNLPRGIRVIGPMAFVFSPVVSVLLPSSLKRIDHHAFCGCAALRRIRLGNGVEEVGSYAFAGCSALAEVTGGSGVVRVGTGAFAGTEWLENRMEQFGGAELGCVSLSARAESKTAAVVPGAVDALRANADRSVYFAGNGCLLDRRTAELFSDTYLNRAVAPEEKRPEVTNLIFKSWKAVCAVWPNDWLMDMFPNVERYMVADQDMDYFTVDGVLFHGDELVMFPPARQGTYRVPDGVRRILMGAFCCSQLTQVELPESLWHLDVCAFVACSRLKRLDIPAGVAVIGEMGGDSPLSRCSGVEEIQVHADNENYFSHDGVLYGRWGQLVAYPSARKGSFTIPEGCCDIGYEAFSGCPELTQVRMASTLGSVPTRAFFSCPRLETVDLCGHDLYVDEASVIDCPGAELVVPAGGTAEKFARLWQLRCRPV